MYELQAARLPFKRQVGIPLYYKGTLISEHRPDLVVGDRVIVEIKSVERLDQIHMAQVTDLLASCNLRTGLILNFNSAMLKHGIRRVIL